MSADELPAAEGRSVRIETCALAVGAERWPYAERHSAEIAQHWQRAQAAHPKLFDGIIFMLRGWSLRAGTFTGNFLRTDFKSYLYWRESGYADASVRDGFGCAVIRSREGHVLLGRQVSGNLNAGRAYPPGGFIDARDIHEGSVDIEASIARELDEETGLEPADLVRVPGYVLTPTGPLLSIAIEWRSALAAEALRTRILHHVRRQPVPELDDVVIARAPGDIDERTMPPHAKAILGLLLGA
jgi:8-oxo-dGTP pyrophosphatase MutT (NUDIX family)